MKENLGDASEDHPLVQFWDDEHNGKQTQIQEVLSKILEHSKNMYDAALDVLGEREWQVLCRMLCSVAGILRDRHLASLEEHKQGQAATLQWHASRASGEWQTDVIHIMNLTGDSELCKKLGMVIETASISSSAVSSDLLASEMRGRAEIFWKLCCCVVSRRCWTMNRLSLCPPYAFAAVMHNRGRKARFAIEKLRGLNAVVLKAVGFAQGLLVPPKLKDCLQDVYFRHTVLYKEVTELMISGGWSFADKSVREQLWELFCGVSQTKKVLEDMIGILKDRTTRQNRNRRISLHKISAECSSAQTLADGNSGKLLELDDSDWNTPRDVPIEEITAAAFHSMAHELEAVIKAGQVAKLSAVLQL